MKNRFKAMSGALALTFMLLFSAVAFAHTTNTSMTKPSMNAPGTPYARNERWRRSHRRHRRHLRRMAHRENRVLRRELKKNG